MNSPLPITFGLGANIHYQGSPDSMMCRRHLIGFIRCLSILLCPLQERYTVLVFSFQQAAAGAHYCSPL